LKTTGVSRRIDDLGRIVLPKEIRKDLKIRDGELLEITVEDEKIILAKHSSMKSINDIAKICADTVSDALNINMMITDRDKVIAASSQLNKKYLGKELNLEISELLLRHNSVVEREPKILKIDNETEENTSYVAQPIIVDGDIAGSVIILGFANKIEEIHEKIAEFIAKLLGRNIMY
jgi:AbrB family transcriptional regulator (stage V sporulation protein T)